MGGQFAASEAEIGNRHHGFPLVPHAWKREGVLRETHPNHTVDVLLQRFTGTERCCHTGAWLTHHELTGQALLRLRVAIVLMSLQFHIIMYQLS